MRRNVKKSCMAVLLTICMLVTSLSSSQIASAALNGNVETLTETYRETYPVNGVLQVAGGFHVFALDKATPSVHTNGNVATNILNIRNNFGTNQAEDELTYVRHYDTDPGDIYTIKGSVILGENNLVTFSNGGETYINGIKVGLSNPSKVKYEPVDKYFVDLEDEFAYLRGLSVALSELTPTLTKDDIEATNTGDQKQITLKDGLNVINLTADDADELQNLIIDKVKSSSTITVEGNTYQRVDGSQALVINIDLKGKTEYKIPFQSWYVFEDGTEVMNNESTYYNGTNILYNVYDSGSADGLYHGDLNNAKYLIGAMLAPSADIYAEAINGNIMGKNVTTTGAETHRCDFLGEFAINVKKMQNNPVEIQLNKIGIDGVTKLSGAEFAVYNIDGKAAKPLINGREVDTLVVDSPDGTIKFVLPEGKYYLQETKAPTGYVLDSTIIPFEITKDGKLKGEFDVTVPKITVKEASQEADLLEYCQVMPDGRVKITVPNVGYIDAATLFDSVDLQILLKDDPGENVYYEIRNENGDLISEENNEKNSGSWFNPSYYYLSQELKKTSSLEPEYCTHDQNNNAGYDTLGKQVKMSIYSGTVFYLKAYKDKWDNERGEFPTLPIESISKLKLRGVIRDVSTDTISYTMQSNAFVKNNEIYVTNEKKLNGDVSFKFLKKDAEGNVLEGARFEILNANGEVLMSWISGSEPYVVSGLTRNRVYTIRETVAPDGYAITNERSFSIDAAGKINPVPNAAAMQVGIDGVYYVSDEKTTVSISKVDIADGEELEGAVIQIIDDKGNVVEEWTSTKEPHVITGLKTGVTYTLRETVAPDGYSIAVDTTFQLNADGTINKDLTTTKISDEGVLLVQDTKKPEPTATPTPTPTEEAMPTPTKEATPTPTEEATPTPTKEATPTPTEEATPTPTKEATPTPTKEATPTPTKEATPTPTKEATPTPTKEATPTPTKAATATPTKEATPTPTKEATPTPTKAATATPTKEATPTPTKAATATPTPTKEATPTPTKAVTPTPTKAATPTPTKEATPTPTKAATATPTPTKAATPTPTKAATPTPTKAVTPTPTKEATPTPTPWGTAPVPTGGATPIVTLTPTGTPEGTPTPTGEATPTVTLTPTGTPEGTPTPTEGATPTVTPVLTGTPEGTPTPTGEATPTPTPWGTAPTPSVTPILTGTPEGTLTPTEGATPTPTGEATPTPTPEHGNKVPTPTPTVPAGGHDENPKTSDSNTIILLFLFAISSLVVVIAASKKTENER